jgi:hypothetical protein
MASWPIITGSGFDDGFINHLLLHTLFNHNQLKALSLTCLLQQSLGHAKYSHSSLVISWQQICNTLTVTTSTHQVFFLQANSIVLLQFSFSFFHNWQLRNSTLSYPLCMDPTENSLFCWQSLFITLLPSSESPIVLRICFCRNVFSDPLPSNGHGADHVENNYLE